MKFFRRKKDEETAIIDIDPLDTEGGAAVKKSNLKGKLKLIGIIAAVAAVVIVVLAVVMSVKSAEGERYAEEAAEYIGSSVAKLNEGGELFYSDTSAYAGVNAAIAYDYEAESEKKIRAGGVSYPSWGIFLEVGSSRFITDVTYKDFTVIKSDMRGIKTDGIINLDRFKDGEKKNTVLKEIPVRPYSITYSQSGIILYTYKYWYVLDNGDEQAAQLRVGISEKGDYKYASTEIITPENL